ncbi:hypothetical protein ERICIII_04876 (plasmid) [Paenibacillus larvae subsp. larvae]|uniref:Uncharacterized protein n=1 Tax=Paenibacillus larvae subsp. larvae TaxID=147375 RepID=A0A2L1U7N8_9BACL|nr:hypothetical protein ERICIII_04876 [Paenibacillus larvae subsp. larvae]
MFNYILTKDAIYPGEFSLQEYTLEIESKENEAKEAEVQIKNFIDLKSIYKEQRETRSYDMLPLR